MHSDPPYLLRLLVLFAASLWAGAQNQLAGGGSFITLPALILTGMDARAANITSTVALFPAQLVTGFTGRADAASPTGLTMRRLFIISLIGGGLGALILLATPPSIFAHLVPWLVLFATALFAWGSFFRKAPSPGETHLSPRAASGTRKAAAPRVSVKASDYWEEKMAENSAASIVSPASWRISRSDRISARGRLPT